ncbi:MAG TPA: ribosome recycling factor [Patescibacteria group bacterium]
MDPIAQATSSQMQKVLQLLHQDIASVRTGRATPSLVENISVSVYAGSARMKVMEVATVVASDSQTLTITPFDKSILDEIQKGIMEANTGFTPSNDGQVIRISIPPLSEERRKELIHLMKQKLENGKIMIRQARQDTMNEIKKGDSSEDEKRRLEKEVQKVTDDFIEKIDAMGDAKEKELLSI